MKVLWEALFLKLKNNADLMNLIGYSEENQSLRRYVDGSVRFNQEIVFYEVLTRPVEGVDTNKIKFSEIELRCVGIDPPETSDIIREIEKMFEDDNESKAYMDLTNSNIHCNWSEITNISTVKRTESGKNWFGVITMNTTWSMK